MDIRRRFLESSLKTESSSWEVDLGGWRLSDSTTNPDPTLFECFESFSNYGGDGRATMLITIKGYSTFYMYVLCHSNDLNYCYISNLDTPISINTNYLNNTSRLKACIKGNDGLKSAFSDYTLVEFTNIDNQEHVITINYENGSTLVGKDLAFVLLPKCKNAIIHRSLLQDNYLTLVAEEGNLILGGSYSCVCEYCIDNDNYWRYGLNSNEPIAAGLMLHIRGNNTPKNIDPPTLKCEQQFHLLGNCMSWLFSDLGRNSYSLQGKYLAFTSLFEDCPKLTSVSENFLPATILADSCYYSMFYNCTLLTNAPKLPATILTLRCYRSMFYGCSKLNTAPELPATTLSKECYSSMFSKCTSLTTAPELPATTLTYNCYDYMFAYCTNLTKASELPATTLATLCCRGMFCDCTSLTSAPFKLPATILADHCYQYMFNGCTSLTNAPILPASILADACYYEMFRNCTNLNYIKMLATDISAESCLYRWANNVASTGTFIKSKDATWTTGVVPTGWEVKTEYIIPIECTSLTITADNVKGNKTNTLIHWTATVNGRSESNEYVEGVVLTGLSTSEEFPQNTSETDTVTREISFTYMGVTATTTITLGVWTNASYTVNLNDNWQLSPTISNPDNSLYDGVYESYSNYNAASSTATMTIDIFGYENFKLYIRSYAESSYDYVMVSQLDQSIDGSTSYSNTSLVKAHTRGKQKSGTAISDYTLVEFTGIDLKNHTITIVYRKDSSQNSGTDRGYVLIPKNQ